MLFQSVGRVWTATLMSMLRSGLFFLPVLMLLSSLFGLAGIQTAQGIADVLTMFVALPFVILFLRQMRKMEESEASGEQEEG